MPTARTNPQATRTTELFAWQGFSFEHLPEFVPVALSGTRAEGYVRLGSVGRLNYQLRWKQAKNPGDLRPRLEDYFRRLERDAKKAKVPFQSEFARADGGITYKYSGVGQGRGRLFFRESCSRVFFVEVVGGRKDSLLPAFRDLPETFTSSKPGEPESWSLFGLRFRVPGSMTVEKKVFQAGRTQLALRCRRARVEASRWGFGSQLVQKHGLENWARAALNLGRADVAEEERGLVFTESSIIRPTKTLVELDEADNQINTLKVAARRTEWRPDWDWLT